MPRMSAEKALVALDVPCHCLRDLTYLRALHVGVPASRPSAVVRYADTPPESALNRRSKRQRCTSKFAAESARSAQRATCNRSGTAAQDPDVRVQALDSDLAACCPPVAPAGASPAQLQQHMLLRAHAIARQGSWPFAHPALISKGPCSSSPAALMTHLFASQTSAFVRPCSFATPANFIVPASHALAPELHQASMPSQAGRGSGKTLKSDSLVQQVLLNTVYSATPGAGCCQQDSSSISFVSSHAAGRCHTHGHGQAQCVLSQAQCVASQAAPKQQQQLATQAPDSIAYLQSTQPYTSSTHSFQLQPWLSQSTMSSAASAPLGPEQQAVLHRVCDQLLSKTLAAAPAHDVSPVRCRGPYSKIPALHGKQVRASGLQAPASLLTADSKLRWPQHSPPIVHASSLITHWAVSLGLQQTDSVFFCLHLWNRLRDKVSTHLSHRAHVSLFYQASMAYACFALSGSIPLTSFAVDCPAVYRITHASKCALHKLTEPACCIAPEF